MLEQVSTAITFYCFFYDSTNNVGKTGLTVTVDVWRGSDASQLINDGSATEIGGGFYKYQLAAGSTATESEYVIVFMTTNTDVSQRQIPALWAVGKAGIENLDATISSRGTSANQTTILARLGSFTGSGVNTILGFLKALMSKAASTPSDVGGTFSAATDSTEALRDGLPGDVWTNSTRTLTQSAASVAAAVSGSTITLSRGDTLSAAITGLGSLSGYVSLDFTVKYSTEDTDDEAVIRIRKNASGSDDGLLRINSAAATGRTANGSITIDNETSGNITIALAAAESDDLGEASYAYDIQMITSSAVSTLSSGTFTVTADVTRLIT